MTPSVASSSVYSNEIRSSWKALTLTMPTTTSPAATGFCSKIVSWAVPWTTAEQSGWVVEWALMMMTGAALSSVDARTVVVLNSASFPTSITASG